MAQQITYKVMEEDGKVILSTSDAATAVYTVYRSVYATGKTFIFSRSNPNYQPGHTYYDGTPVCKWADTPITKANLDLICKECNCTAIQYMGVEILKALIERLEDKRWTPKLTSYKGVVKGKQSDRIAKIAAKIFSNSSKELREYFKEDYELEYWRVGRISVGLIFTSRGVIKY